MRSPSDPHTDVTVALKTKEKVRTGALRVRASIRRHAAALAPALLTLWRGGAAGVSGDAEQTAGLMLARALHRTAGSYPATAAELAAAARAALAHPDAPSTTPNAGVAGRGSRNPKP